MNTKIYVCIWVAVAITIRLVFWVGGVDIFERSKDAGFVLFLSIFAATVVTVIINQIFEDK